VAIFGLEGVGAHLAWMLAASSVGTVVLIDPFRCMPTTSACCHVSGREGRASRHEITRAYLAPAAPSTVFQIAGETGLSKEAVPRSPNVQTC